MLKDKTIVILGGGGLLGRSFVQAVLDNHGTVVIADTDEEKTQQLIAENQWSTCDYIKSDITSKASLNSLLKTASNKHGKIDSFVNSSYPHNKNYGAKFEDVTYEDFIENVSLALGGTFNVIQQLCLFFKKQGFGNIINISSIYGVMPPRFEIYKGTKMTMPVEYAAIKSAMLHLTKYAAQYMRGMGIRLNCISPGGIEDGKQPSIFKEQYNQYGLSKGLLDAKDLNGALLFLLSDHSKYINGQNIIVDDGWSL